ncbi:DNA repair protein RecO [Altibacter sp. HG106]|uniref:DNA repair protein RecO n=1 Tax=Altibacter sp. HG106 TaxID=3023937 RepID=UPI002350C1EF|nr:DNA repair protein RecO [Altibacter sp. HG106]MDC7994834.1 DNA repair protein RecO [Altibacter sp. HG106]
MTVTTPAIVLTAVKYSEADLIVSCYTKEAGLKSYLLRNLLKSKRGKLKPSYFQPLTQLNIDAVHRDKGTLERIREAQVAYPYQSLHTDVIKSSVTLFLAEVLKSSIKEEEANEALFQFLQESLLRLDVSSKSTHFPILFLLKLTAYLGFYPDFSEAQLPYFNMLEGSFQMQEFGHAIKTREAVQCILAYNDLSWEDVGNVRVSKTQRKEALSWLLEYYQLHVENFKQPKSLEVLQTVFS